MGGWGAVSSYMYQGGVWFLFLSSFCRMTGIDISILYCGCGGGGGRVVGRGVCQYLCPRRPIRGPYRCVVIRVCGLQLRV